MKKLLALPLLLVAAAGCGGGSSHIYSADATKNCVLSAAPGVAYDANGWDYISQGATGGSYSLGIDNTRVILGFFASPQDASQAVSSYKAFGPGALFQEGNVTAAWDSVPTSGQTDLIKNCLK